MEIQQAQVRKNAKPRREPYWRPIKPGFSMGFRKSATGGTWIARWRDPESGKQHYKALGSITDTTYEQATAEADRWVAQCQHGTVKVETVNAALAAYVEDRKIVKKGRRTAADADNHFKALIYGEDAPPAGRNFGSVRLDRLKPLHVSRFRDALVEDGSRTAGTANRIMSNVRAALNHAFNTGNAPSNAAWKRVEAFPEADGRRDVYLAVEQRRAILKEASPELADFLTGILYTAARPGDLARATVGDLDTRKKTLRLVTHKGRHGIPRPYHADLTGDAAALFLRHARLRMKNLPLLVNEFGREWKKKHWASQLRAAVAAARENGADLPDGIVAYTFRHCAITDWLRQPSEGGAGMNVGDVAKQSGTSIGEINKHYYQPGNTRTIRESITVV